MPKIKYIDKRFNKKTVDIIEQAENIIEAYQQRGLKLTLRQLYYQFIAKALMENNRQNYVKLSNVISDARRAGLIDWDSIEDRTRYLRELSSWDSPKDILVSAMDSYHTDLWLTQNLRVEVWIEKDALVGVIEDVCKKWDVPYFACRGWVSDSELWSSAMRHFYNNRSGQRVLILYLGDHDPSGLDMIRDVEERLNLFSYNSNIELRPIALTMKQIEILNPPPNFAKVDDPRYKKYVEQFGEDSWELDALDANYIIELINTEIECVIDDVKWADAVKHQEKDREQIKQLIQELR